MSAHVSLYIPPGTEFIPRAHRSAHRSVRAAVDFHDNGAMASIVAENNPDTLRRLAAALLLAVADAEQIIELESAEAAS